MLNVDSIEEAQKLWDKLVSSFGIKDIAEPLNESINEANKDIYFDKNIKRLLTAQTDDDSIVGAQILANDILVFCFVLNKPRDHKTDSPDKDWAEQLDSISISNDSPHVYGIGTVLQTITDDPQQVAVLVKENLEKYKVKKIRSCVLEFGKLWQYGYRSKYLLTISRANEEAANRFLANNFAYILTLQLKIEKHYLLAVQLYEGITKQEILMDEQKNNLDNFLKTNELTLLENKRDEIRAISKETTDNLAYLRDCGINIKSNIINLKDAIEDLNIVEGEDEIFSNNLELFEEHVQNINSWDIVCESTLMRLNKTSSDIETDLKERIEELRETKGETEIAPAMPVQPSNISEEMISIELGNSYIINENELGESLSIFEKILQTGNLGLCITRTQPDELKKSYNLENAIMYWLSNTSCEFCIPPSPTKILHAVTPFSFTHKKSVLLLEGSEYLISNNDFNKVLKLVENVKELVSLHRSILILPLSFSAFSEKEITLIAKNMIDITNVDVDVETLRN